MPAGMWAPPGSAARRDVWKYDFRSGWLPPGEDAEAGGTQFELDPGVFPGVGQGTPDWSLLVSPPGTLAPPDAVNYTPSRREIAPPGQTAPVGELNLSMIPGGTSDFSSLFRQVPSKPPQTPSQAAQSMMSALGVGQESPFGPAYESYAPREVYYTTPEPNQAAPYQQPASDDSLVDPYGLGLLQGMAAAGQGPKTAILTRSDGSKALINMQTGDTIQELSGPKAGGGGGGGGGGSGVVLPRYGTVSPGAYLTQDGQIIGQAPPAPIVADGQFVTYNPETNTYDVQDLTPDREVVDGVIVQQNPDGSWTPVYAPPPEAPTAEYGSTARGDVYKISPEGEFSWQYQAPISPEYFQTEDAVVSVDPVTGQSTMVYQEPYSPALLSLMNQEYPELYPAPQPVVGMGEDFVPPVDPSQVVGTGHRFGEPVSMEGVHKGTDLQAYRGTPAVSPVDGVVARIEMDPMGLGLQVVIRDEQGQEHTLAHLDRADVQPGQPVRAGDPVAAVGSTGAGSTGPHLDYRIQEPDGEYVNPEPALGRLAQLPRADNGAEPTGMGEEDPRWTMANPAYGMEPNVTEATIGSMFWGDTRYPGQANPNVLRPMRRGDVLAPGVGQGWDDDDQQAYWPEGYLPAYYMAHEHDYEGESPRQIAVSVLGEHPMLGTRPLPMDDIATPGRGQDFTPRFAYMPWLQRENPYQVRSPEERMPTVGSQMSSGLELATNHGFMQSPFSTDFVGTDDGGSSSRDDPDDDGGQSEWEADRDAWIAEQGYSSHDDAQADLGLSSAEFNEIFKDNDSGDYGSPDEYREGGALHDATDTQDLGEGQGGPEGERQAFWPSGYYQSSPMLQQEMDGRSLTPRALTLMGLRKHPMLSTIPYPLDMISTPGVGQAVGVGAMDEGGGGGPGPDDNPPGDTADVGQTTGNPWPVGPSPSGDLDVLNAEKQWEYWENQLEASQAALDAQIEWNNQQYELEKQRLLMEWQVHRDDTMLQMGNLYLENKWRQKDRELQMQMLKLQLWGEAMMNTAYDNPWLQELEGTSPGYGEPGGPGYGPQPYSPMTPPGTQQSQQGMSATPYGRSLNQQQGQTASPVGSQMSSQMGGTAPTPTGSQQQPAGAESGIIGYTSYGNPIYDYGTYSRMTPYQRAALRTDVAQTGEDWDHYTMSSREGWGLTGGPTEMSDVAPMTAADYDYTDMTNQNQLVDTFGMNREDYWNQQSDLWSAGDASGAYQQA